MAQSFIVQTTGIGKPDYTSEISSGIVKPGEALKINQQTVMFGYTPTDIVVHPYAIPWVKPVLAAGATSHIYDMATGIVTPYTIPAGYTLTMTEKSWDFNQDFEMWLYFDGDLVAVPAMAIGGNYNHIAQIVNYSSALFDPAALVSHTIECVVYNRGAGDMRGGVEIVCLLEAVGTPPFPTKKTTKCPFCGALQVVPVTDTVIVCKGCTRIYRVYNTTSMRR